MSMSQVGRHKASRKGIVLAGGSGSRLHPLTLGVSKQLLPVFDKPLIYYPIATLIMSGVREVLFITTPDDASAFKRLLGDGSQWGMDFNYAVQDKPRGLADAYRIGRAFLDGAPSVLILGDNIFFGHGLKSLLERAAGNSGATIFTSLVRDPTRFGVVELDSNQRPVSIEEKPEKPRSRWAATGLYFLDHKACDFADEVLPSKRGEIEIISILQRYLDDGNLNVETLHRGFAWLDAGTHESLHQAGEFVKTLQDRQGLLVSSPEELAFRHGLIDVDQLSALAESQKQSSYGEALMELVNQVHQYG
ncbi:glucose-1-phosphate thymidylyltransferase RfbA [Hoeflea sp. EC-HK425]|uniref:glucose-1-phosphate thymidylyltransferase RfbA n=1 Tax=Hoeflea sp. EC-HK425 TaxID=2038388 RepID=UPI001252187D|nr:glucose-1-phosphate thymidylyltransferase [Hoeflea sp. EC-HK425]